ncbi:unnamed protein product [Musa acuminata var. zebrina]
MGWWVRSCLQSVLKMVNSMIGLTGMGMILYALWMLRSWYKHLDGTSFGVSGSTPPWFIYTFLGLGISLCLITCVGHIAAETANSYCLSCYMVFVFLFITLEAAITAFIFLNRDWEEDFPEDPTGEFNELKNFVKSNFEMCEWIGLLVVATQALSIFAAMVLRALGPDSGTDCDSDDDAIPARLPLLRNQIHLSRLREGLGRVQLIHPSRSLRHRRHCSALATMSGGAAAACLPTLFRRCKTTSAQYVASRSMDPTFEKLMEGYKHFLKVLAVQDLILASPSASLPLPVLSAAAPRLRLSRGATHFVRTFPRIFSLLYDPSAAQPLVRLTPTAARIASDESDAASASAPDAVDRLRRLLCMSSSRSLPLRAVFRVWRELGLPDDFEDSIIARNSTIFVLRTNPRETNTHLLEFVDQSQTPKFTPVVDAWRCQERNQADEAELKFAFKQGFPPGMRLTKNYRARLKEWQRLPCAGPYDVGGGGNARSKAGMRALEKRAVGIAHEFVSLTVEKMVEVEKISHFRKWFGVDLNIRDLFLDHPGMFYLSTKGKRHTVFLREAYDKGRLIDPNPIYEARRRLLELVLMRRRGMGADSAGRRASRSEEDVEVDMEEGCSSDSDTRYDFGE